MDQTGHYFLCGVGGSGMLPLALILRARGLVVSGSDRALDQGRTGAKFDYLAAEGVSLFPQDGSGVVSSDQIVVASAAVEDSVPDIAAAIRLGCRRRSRAEILAELFNAAALPVGVAGTSGKSTTTAMIAYALHAAGRDPTAMNGAVMRDFAGPDRPFASALVGRGAPFVSELDESDGSIALFRPAIAVLTNVTLDHKPMAELRTLFGDYLAKAGTAVVNADDPESAALGARITGRRLDFSIAGRDADFAAEAVRPQPFGVSFRLRMKGRDSLEVALRLPGRHNVANALAAIAACAAAGVDPHEAARHLGSFRGVARRFEFVGEADGVAVIDDFGHNPDKIAATLRTLHDFPGRLLVMFQPHGFGPLKKMRAEFAETFAAHLGPDDVLLMPEPVYYGGTVTDRSVDSAVLAADIRATGRNAEALPTRADCGERLLALARPGDRIVVMGARDDTLPEFAREILSGLAAR